MKKRTIAGLLVFLLIATLVLSACNSGTGTPSGGSATQGGSTTTGGTTTTNPGTPVKDTLVFGLISEPATLDPINSSERITYLPIHMIHDTLIQEDQQQNLVPCLAKEWKISEDGLTYTFILQDDVKFHNGDDLTVEDCIFTINKIRETKPDTYGLINNIEKIDDSSFKFTID